MKNKNKTKDWKERLEEKCDEGWNAQMQTDDGYLVVNGHTYIEMEEFIEKEIEKARLEARIDELEAVQMLPPYQEVGARIKNLKERLSKLTKQEDEKE